MKDQKVYIGSSKSKKENRKVSGEFIKFQDDDFYVIRNYDMMKPFLMSVVSDSDHWMYISSTGGLTAGRVNPEKALFPYYTDDKVHESSENTGSKSIFLVEKNNNAYLWEPFSNAYNGIYSIKRNLYKNRAGNRLVFEEINDDLRLSFRYQWMNSDKYGWIKESEIENLSEDSTKIRFLDGIQNILPFGISKNQQEQYSTLMDAYKKTELVADEDLALFRMSSIPVDRAEPSEALRVNVAWLNGLNKRKILLSVEQLDKFREGESINTELNVRGLKGAFFVNSEIELGGIMSKKWQIVLDLSYDITAVNELRKSLKKSEDIYSELIADVKRGTKNLVSLVNDADGFQESGDQLVSSRHFSNVLFNIMRGGIYDNAYQIRKSDLIVHFDQFNTEITKTHNNIFENLAETLDYRDVKELMRETKDPDIFRIFLEYLPLSFSRRHGDPSRPWNLFSVNLKNEDGSKKLYYAGNWRDIFQNWEALSFSFPYYLDGIIAKFVNASTADGYNPYRITREGIDWEIHDPTDPWSNIGYWGDHQVIYLLKLMELSEKFFPGKIQDWFNEDIFTYANVPYRIKDYQSQLKDSYNTIEFDEELNTQLLKKYKEIGADGKLLRDKEDSLILVNLLEKILVSLLTKLSNFIPGAGIWMNTQRPEWNDANNALVGNGSSMVTLYYIRRFVSFMNLLLEKEESAKEYKVSLPISDFLLDVYSALKNRSYLGSNKINDEDRKKVIDELGQAGSKYRSKVYKGLNNSERGNIKVSEIKEFLELCLIHIDHSIRLNKREDNLYHAYNLVSIGEESIKIRNLHEMLEGQTAVLSSGTLKSSEAVEVLDALRISKMYRQDQNSYSLYPDKDLAQFLQINIISPEKVLAIPLLKLMLSRGDFSIVSKDVQGNYHFNSDFNNSEALQNSLNILKANIELKITEKDISMLLELYEETFDHQSFTGRSGTFFKYEGLGSIYWHMVSKLVLAIGEIIQKDTGEDPEISRRLLSHYREVKDGIGVHKNPENYGAFPTDPYSHTPSMMGVQQPGMTGQVKEDILSRFFELGLRIKEGEISFSPEMIEKQEFFNLEGSTNPSMSFSFCNVLIVYSITGKKGLDIHLESGKLIQQSDYILTKDWTEKLISRKGGFQKIVINLE